MGTPRLYVNSVLATGNTITLTESTSRHCVQVLRLGTGDPVTVFNGQGGEYSGELHLQKKQPAQVHLTAFHHVNRESPRPVTLYQGIGRGDNMDYALQKATECGVHTIVPVITEYCQVKQQAAVLEKKWRHWEGVVVSACEQSGRTKVPALRKPVGFESIIETSNPIQLVFHPSAEHSFREWLNEMDKNSIEPVSVLIGPEGGLSDEEFERAIKNGWQALGLGPRVLRMETAASVVVFYAGLSDLGL